MHVLVTANTAWNIWNFRKPIVSSLLDEGHSVTVFAPPDSSVANLESLGCAYLPLEMDAKGLSPIDGLKLTNRFKQTFRETQPDIALSYTIKNNLFGAIGARAENIPFIPNVTGLGTAFLSGRMLERVAKFLYRHAFAALPVVFFQNEDDRTLFLQQDMVSPQQARLLPGSGIDLDHFPETALPSTTDAPIFLMIARLLRDKGVIEFVEGARIVKKDYPKSRFQLLGAIGSENRTAIDATMVEEWVAEGVVEYLGTTDDVRPVITAASCVVLPSYREGAPRTLIESAAMARPVITTDVPGCRAIVDDGISGLLCEVRNSKSLASAVKAFLKLSAEAQKEMGRAGRKKMMNEFDQEIVVQAYRDAIFELLAKPKT
ncbi:glycosyltransferase family 4 protein [Henriciella marina]|uniref:glycosyltransferase family 4 protein n=1 Tax=Henriciella marina TaxID=453851 RepID=UPI00047703A4|nr:glycosyltransferase family 4 protein [Henriciella marina]